MAKLIIFLVLFCIEFSRQEGIELGENLGDVLSEDITFPEQEINDEMYPFDINLDKFKYDTVELDSAELAEEYNKAILEMQSWMAHLDLSDYLWLTSEVEGALDGHYYYDVEALADGKHSGETSSPNPGKSFKRFTSV